MTDVLIRDVPSADLDLIRSTAAAQGMSVQAYLRDTLQAQAVFLRRRQALAKAQRRLTGRPALTEADRDAIRAAIDLEHEGRAAQLSLPSTP